MSNFTVSNPVDGFMQSATRAAMRSAVGLGSSIFNVQDAAYGAKGDGRVFRDAGVTSSSTTITSASAAFTGADVGRTIVIELTSTSRQITTIASVTNGTTAVLTSAATGSATNSTVYLGTNDTTAIQAAITAAYNASGGTVYIPTGLYILTGALQDTSLRNSVLTIPNPDMGTAQPIRTIVLQGDVPAPSGYTGYSTYPSSTSGSSLYIGTPGSGTNPSAISGNADNWSTVNFYMRNIGMLSPRNPTIGALNFATGAGCIAMDCSFVTDKADESSATIPSTSTVGVWMPGNSNTSDCLLVNCWIQGYGVGAKSSDHGTFIHCVFAQNTVGLYVDEGLPTYVEGCHFVANLKHIGASQSNAPRLFGSGITFEADSVTTSPIDDARGILSGFITAFFDSLPPPNLASVYLDIRGNFNQFSSLSAYTQTARVPMQAANSSAVPGWSFLASGGTLIGELMATENFGQQFILIGRNGSTFFLFNQNSKGLKIPGTGNGDPTVTDGNLVLQTAGMGVVFAPVVVASLPTSPVVYQTVMVTDALTPVKGATVVGGGSVAQLVMWNNSNWVVL